MTIELAVGAAVEEFRRSGRIVIVGASLAGLRAAEALREEGFTGTPDHHRGRAARAVRPPAAVEAGAARVGAGRPHQAAAHAGDRRRLAARGGGDRAGSDHQAGAAGRRRAGRVRPAADRHRRPRPALVQPGGGRAGRGVHACAPATTRPGCGRRWPAGPRRVLIVGAGFIGSEVASVCRELDLDVTVAERGEAPLVGALGGVIGEIAAEMQRDARRRPAHRRLGDVARGRRERTRAARHAVRRDHARRRRGGGRRSARSATSSGWRAPGWRPGCGASAATPAAAPSTSTAW